MRFAYFFKGKPETRRLFPSEIEVVEVATPLDNGPYTDEQMRSIADCEVIYVQGSYITEQVLKAAPKVRMIQTAGAGYDKLDVAGATRRGIVCCNNGDMNSSRVADFAMMMVLNLMRKSVETVNLMNAGDWQGSRQPALQSVEVEGKTLGIIGCGNIGSKVGRRAHAFDMKVLYNDVRPEAGAEMARQTGATRVEKEEIYRTADAITIHTLFNDSTRGMIGERELAMMKPGAFLVCTARGNIVDEKALRRALDEGRLGGAAMDVYSVEPPKPDNPLFGARNLYLTPHIAGKGREGVEKSFFAAINNLRGFLEGRRPNNVLNPEVLK